MHGQSDHYALLASIEEYLGLSRILFPEQIRFVRDPSKRKAALCSRRAGKSFAVGVYLCETAVAQPDSICIYVALTRLTAKRILWPALRKINQLHALGMAFNATELTVCFPNGSQIWLTGAEDQGQIEKLRGSAYHLVVIDEAASFGAHLDELIDEVLEPALLDHDGTLCLIGTPSAACTGKFHEVTTLRSEDWSVHRWTVLNNPHLPRAQEWLEHRRLKNGWTLDHPIYRREWLGEWVWDAESLVYKFSAENICSSFPPQKAQTWHHILGVDLGYHDNTAFQLVSSSSDGPNCYIHRGEKHPRMDVTNVAAKIREYMAQWEITQVVIDTGGIGKMLAEELSIRQGLPIKAAEKTDKMGAIELLNGDLFARRVFVLHGEPVLREWEVLQWDETRKKEDPRYPNDLSDATTYAYREAVHWAHRPPVLLPKMGTEDYMHYQEQLMDAENSENDEA